ncbi:MmcQ/YjbR family DNA-binding protein [Enterococcus sp. BWB1-3]|uniref:MmcQ/YjbR family DNA-binding protein n=1 Tax=unclassified Enterococcus TaxID=2608891 RepID=UPI001922CA1F|nr:MULTISPECIES: MmcQ/YjbR family DNA-binding protein [unclassified Enterococcus]MBL1229430.1 MmcQ/YjbR family DNA-binding protein [Enterococcus sp. BWB1-3]MCB5956291.1 MmcQ/YjbR family DNA-binding protein [Enterococcus sp. CWB-B31]
MEELKEVIKKEAGKLPGASVYYRESWGCDYFDIAGKFFALMGTNKEGDEIFTFKGLPEENELLREQYTFVVPGYYANKTHWNSIILKDSTFSEKEYLGLMKKSYELTAAKLPKKVRENLVE